MKIFRLFLAVIFLTIVIYTIFVVKNHGLGLLPIFFGDIRAMTWPGQFNLDFLGFLVLSGTWMAWRNHFSPKGILLGILGFFGGMPVLAIYLFILSLSAADMKEILLGKNRAAGL